MTPEQFITKLAKQQQAMERLVHRELPVKVGREAKDHFQENFHKGGFVDGGLHRWKPAKRISNSKDPNSKYGTLLSKPQHLHDSIDYVPGNAEVHIQNKVPYAAVHNEGGKAGRGKGFIMPKRQFIGDSKELDEKIMKTMEESVEQELKRLNV